ncbi:VOC family protein [Saccharothrix isguenensis]
MPSALRAEIFVADLDTLDDVHAEASRVQAEGLPLGNGVQVRPWGLTDFRIHDPDGYYLRLTSA